MGLIITLILVGLILIFAEVLIIPGVGIAGVLGLLSIGGSCYYAFYEFGAMTGAIVTGVNVLLLVLLTIWILRAKTWKKMTLETNISSRVNVPEIKVSIGDRGRSMTRLAPMGTVRFGESSIEATAQEGLIDAGVEVQVVLIDDNKVFVEIIK